MRPVRVEFQAFGPYVGREIVDFEAMSEKGLFLICGKTGTGKTMILDAMTFALYGKSSGHSRDDFEAMRCTNAAFEQTTYVKFEFENNGEYFLFERRLERKRKNLSASYNVMQRDEDGSWKPLLENAREKALNEKAVEIIGLEYEQFRQVIVLPQGQFEKLLTSNSDEKEKILTSIFGEDKWQAIAEQLYNETVGRKEQLKGTREKIQNSLKEEQCDSLSELREKIAQKEAERKELELTYETAGYERQIKRLQELLAVSRRFGDLHKAEERVKRLGEQYEARAHWGRQVKDAVRAGKVRVLLEAAEQAGQALSTRQTEEAHALKRADQTRERAEHVAKALKMHADQMKTIEEQRLQKLQYEGKRADYEGIETAAHVVYDTKAAEKNAQKQEEAARQYLDGFASRISELQGAYNASNECHKQCLERYLAGITGELAQQLVEGEPCPVCGSTLHPHKADKADNHVTRAMVDRQKAEAEQAYQKLQDTLAEQEAAKAAYDDAHAAVERKHAEAVTAQAQLDAMRKNLVAGITTLQALNAAILDLGQTVTAYERKKAALEEDQKYAQEAYAAAGAAITAAKKETSAAREHCRMAKQAVEAALREQQFTSVDEAGALFIGERELEALKKQIADYDANVKVAQKNLDELRQELADIEEPDEVQCQKQLTAASDARTLYAENKGILSTEINRLTEKRTMLEAEGEGMEEKIREAEEDFAFAKKLRGDSGTGLQRYVLGIMFSSVVAAANQMLELVHGGRYRLYRSDEKAQGTNKRGLELKVFDRNSVEHGGRFVSTLSGGEKFLASLALSIGMSTIAQKSGIKIEALFIDEGFGSLDEDSISDAMNILGSIQQANGLVGIISHVQLLQDRIPTKLQVQEVEGGSHIIQTIG